MKLLSRPDIYYTQDDDKLYVTNMITGRSSPIAESFNYIVQASDPKYVILF